MNPQVEDGLELQAISEGVILTTSKKEVSANIDGKKTYILGCRELSASPTDDKEDQMMNEVAAQCHCSVEELEDVYPCTPLQEGMMVQTLKDAAAYTMEHQYRLPFDVDLERLRAAWQRTAQVNPILRTRIVPTRQHGSVQAVIRGPVPWEVQFDDNDGVLAQKNNIIWRPGAPLAYFSINPTRHTLKLVIHHSIFDYWSNGLLLWQADAAYRGEQLVYRPFRPLVDYIQKIRLQADAFWEEEFHDAHESSMRAFPSLPTPGYAPRPSSCVERNFDIHPSSAAVTVNSKLRLAWALLQSVYTGSLDTIFGSVSAGREVPVAGIQELSGPALVSIPVRIKLDPQHRVADALSAVQAQWASSMDFQHVGMQNLLRLGPGPKAACQFQTLMSIEPREGRDLPSLFAQSQSEQKNYDLYSLILRCRPNVQSMQIELVFDPVVIEVRQAERILAQLVHIYEQIDTQPDLLLGEIDPISPEDHRELVHRNILNKDSAGALLCVHHLIQQRTQQQPQAPAINSWDGDLSYQDLDDWSSALAERLVRNSVRCGMFVPLCLGKSKWVAVAMLAVMKAGAAFALLDPEQPISRLQTMCQTMDATVILTSDHHAYVASQIGISMILNVDSKDEQEEVNPSSLPLPSVSPNDILYTTFTSGSTGVPKGVIVQHSGYAASALAHGSPYHFTPQSRVLQFASPAFDSCIVEHLSVLIMGGCVCIPSADDCYGNLTEAMDQFRVTVACLTPTVTRIVNPEHVSTLEVLAFVGEAVLTSDVARWEPFVQVGNAYGPSECSAVFSIQPRLQRHDPSNIGFPTGGVGWVVHPDDDRRLLPIGCPGELVIEGPIVGQGYLSNPDQTAKVLIEAPHWRRNMGHAPSGRLYKTGDLVQCTGDGSFRYLGRKDTQVKLHGQRLELSDVEHHLRHAFPQASQVVAEILRSTGGYRRDHRPDAFLTAFICLPSSSASSHENDLFLPPSDKFSAACMAAESMLSESLPTFMVPQVFLPISRVPQTPSGKTNRRYIREQSDLLSWEAMQAYRVLQERPQKPSGWREDKLQQIWAQTLNRPIEEVAVTESFFRLGGDSVSAMQVAASCQAAGLHVVVADIFRFPSIRKLAEKVEESSGPIGPIPGLEDDPNDNWFDLSPIQKLFFEHVPEGHNRFTLEFVLRIARLLPTHEIQRAVQMVVARHSMLRARFDKQSDGQWRQSICPDTEDRLSFQEHWLPSVDDRSGLQRIISDSQSLLDIKQGPLMRVDLIHTETGQQYLVMMAHHLAIDLVSWRVVLQDLEDIMTTGNPLQGASLSFQHWCRLQQGYAAESLDPQEALVQEIPAPPLGYWGTPESWEGNTWAQAERQSITVGREATQAILGSANDAFHTRPVEVIQTAVLYSFIQAFDDRPAPAIFSEGHGREPWDSRMDISRTVGWFTTIAPLFVDAKKGQEISDLLERTKDGRRGIPSNGWAYFASRYLHPDGADHCKGHSPMEILFNYTGLFQQLERPGALLQLTPIHDRNLLSMPADLPRFALIDVNATIMDGCLNVSFIFNRNMPHQDRLQEWMQSCLYTLEILPSVLQQEQRLTVSDFPLLSLAGEDQLRTLLHQIAGQFDVSSSGIEDIYPCSPIQLGIWFSQLKRPQIYWSHVRWSVHSTSADAAPLDIATVQQAWQQVVDHNAMLRTVFVDGAGMNSHPVQVVLKSTPANIQVISESETHADQGIPSLPDEFLLNRRRIDSKGCPPHRLTIAMDPGGQVSCSLTIHHILVDGATEQKMLTDFHRALNGQLDGTPVGQYSTYLHYLHDHHQIDSEGYWKGYLEGVNPCIFPSLSTKPEDVTPDALKSFAFRLKIGQDLRTFCQNNGITISSLLQVAWGLVLRLYTGSESVCYGYLHSCRDIPMENVRDISGPLINLLVCRLSLADDALVLSTLLDNHDAYARSIDHQHCSLAETMHSLGLSGHPLFNTAMSLQREVPDLFPGPATQIAVVPEDGIDSTEYPLTINITAGEATIRCDLTYWTHLITEVQAELIADTFHHLVLQLIDPANTSLKDLNLVSPMNMNHMLKSNRHVPQTVEACIHTDIHRHSLTHPAAPAIAAWDGNFTYGELDKISSTLARHLHVEHGVGAEVFVPICCDKSRWTVVAILAVLKAGGAFILLDPSHPPDRLREIMQQDFKSRVILTSSHHATLAASLAPQVIVVEQTCQQLGSDPQAAPLPSMFVSPTSAAYAIFTSGSTGKPKASVVEHQSFRSSVEHHHKIAHIDKQSRVLQFSSYAFDVSLIEILTTLLVGGCVCIPSESDRYRRLAQVISEFEVNWAVMTPSVSRILDPSQVSSTLKTLVLGGESMLRDDVRRWSPYVRLINGYGPSECSVFATAQSSPQYLWHNPSNIGPSVGTVTWVVHPQEPNTPVPVGAVGELLLEGPTVGRGYVNRPDLTAKTFIPSPAWLKEIRGSSGKMLYRAGDLARFCADGTIQYLGRKDRQVKLRGQRIELAEIEHHVQQCFPDHPEVYADVVTHPNSKTACLVATIVQPDSGNDPVFEAAVAETQSRLQGEVPIFLIPSAFIPIRQVPRLASGKIDRRKLHQDILQALQQQMEQSTPSRNLGKLANLTAEERTMLELWSQTLHRPIEMVGIDDHFFRSGGDSIAAMKLSSAARAKGLKLAVPDVFRHPILRNLVKTILPSEPKKLRPPHEKKEKKPRQKASLPAFSLLPAEHRKDIQTQAALQCGVSLEEIEDIYPCTALQAGLAALTAERPGTYVANHRFRLSQDTDLERLREAWTRVAAGNSILRTRLIGTESGCLQVLIRDDQLIWITGNNPGLAWEVVFGQPLVQFELVPVPETEQCDLMITMHHAIYDSWSFPLLVHQAQMAYQDLNSPSLSSTSFQHFIQYSMSQEKAALEHFGAEFRDLDVDPFPSLPDPSYRPRATTQIESTIHTGPLMHEWVSRTTAIRLAWALVQSQYQSCNDVVFGIVSPGRTAPVMGIETMVGPTIATFPLRVMVHDDMTVAEALAELHEKAVQLIPFEQVGLPQIAALGPEAACACAFQTLLIEARGQVEGMQADTGVMQALGTSVGEGTSGNYALQLAITLKPEQVTVAACFDDAVLPNWRIQHMLDQFSHMLQQVHRQPQHKMRDIFSLNPHDIQQLQTWSLDVSPAAPLTIMDVIRPHWTAQAQSPAVASSAGSLSYKELDFWSTNLAHLLVSHGVGPECFVPIYLNRSHWAVVAVLGVLKAGAAFVLLDSSHPQERLNTICHQVQAPLIVSSANLQDKARSLVSNVVLVGQQIEHDVPSNLPHVLSPKSAAYTVFTSGSTGKPKGVVIENEAFVTMALEHARIMGMNSQSRVLNFSSYAFDVSITEILVTLMAGACICVLSESERKERLVQSIIELQPSHALFIPSVLRALTPGEVSSIRTIMVGGEVLRASDIQQWEPHVQLVNGYGPAECTVTFTVQSSISINSQPKNIGFPLTGATWVTDVRDPHRLAPVGAVGELLLQGPQVSRGYLNDPEQTAVAFISPPSWMLKLGLTTSLRDTRVYRTGDLVRYEEDGSLTFQGRKDGQVKLRGQRFEVGDVERQVHEHFPEDLEDVVAELVTPASAVQSTYLVVFVTSKRTVTTPAAPSPSLIPSLEITAPPHFGDQVAQAKHRLEEVLPHYMIPSIFVPLRRMPQTNSGKVDRRQLRESVELVTRQELVSYLALKAPEKRAPGTEAEWALMRVWERALSIPRDQIGAEDSFFRLGGDSISALKATSQARAAGIDHSVEDLFRWRTISEIARRFSTSSPGITDSSSEDDNGSSRTSAQSYAPYSLVADHERKAILSAYFSQPHPFSSKNVTDILPVLELQKFYLTHSSPTSMAHIFPAPLDVNRLRHACREVMAHHSVLRTVFVEIKDRFFQAVLQNIEPTIDLIQCEDPRAYVTEQSQQTEPSSIAPGSLPVRFSLITSRTRPECVFVVRISHAQYDAASMPILWESIASAYHGCGLPHAEQFQAVVQDRLQNSDSEGTLSFWRKYLHEIPAAALDPLTIRGVPRASEKNIAVLRQIPRPSLLPDTTTASLVKAALCCVLKRYIPHSDIILGQAVHGRGGSLRDIDTVLGPCLNILPIRVKVNSEQSVEDLVRHVQAQQVKIVPYENVSFQDIVNKTTSWPKDAKLGCLTHHQSGDPGQGFEMGGVRSSSSINWASSKPPQGQIVVLSSESGQHLELTVTAAEYTINHSTAESLVERLAETIKRFSNFPQSSLAEVTMPK